MPMEKHRYPANWKEIATAVKDAAGWKCEECGKQCRKPGEPLDTHRRTLTVHHIDHVPENCDPSNLIALCAPCHLKADKEHHAETRRRHTASRNAKRGIGTREAPKDGHSGHENEECGEILATDESR